MAMASFRRRKLPTEPEEVLNFAQRLLELIKPYLKWVVAGAAGLGLLLAAWGINGWIKAGREDRAAKALAQVAPRLDQADQSAETLKDLEKLIKDNSGTHAAQQVEFFRAHLLYRLNKYADATTAYESLLGRVPGWDPLIKESLSYCYEAQGELRKAAEVLGSVAEKASPAFRGEFLARQARLLERVGDRQGANQIWRQLLEAPPSPAMVPYLKERAAATQTPEGK